MDHTVSSLSISLSKVLRGEKYHLPVGKNLACGTPGKTGGIVPKQQAAAISVLRGRFS